jgi:hypothetical protein
METFTCVAAAHKLGISREHFTRRFNRGARVFVTTEDIYRVDRERDPTHSTAYRYSIVSMSAVMTVMEQVFSELATAGPVPGLSGLQQEVIRVKADLSKLRSQHNELYRALAEGGVLSEEPF